MARAGGALFEQAAASSQDWHSWQRLVAMVVSDKLRGPAAQDAEDVASAVWERLLSEGGRRLAGFAGRARFETWLSKVALNAARDHLRRSRIQTVSLDAEVKRGEKVYTIRDILGDSSPQPLQRLLKRELRSQVAAAVRDLPKRYREVVYARFYRGWTPGQIAERLRMPEATVYVRLSRAYQRLGKALADYAGPEWGITGTVWKTVTGDAHLPPENASRWIEDLASGQRAPPWPEHLRSCEICRDNLLGMAIVWRVLRELHARPDWRLGRAEPPAARLSMAGTRARPRS